MSGCTKYNKVDTCPSPPICQWLNNKCKNYNLVDLNNSFAFNVSEPMTNMSDSDNSDLIDGVKNTMDNITMIQSLESDIYNKLLQNDVSQTMSSDDVDKAMSELGNLSIIKINLYDSIKDMFENSVDTMTVAQDNVQEQLSAIKIVEKELQNSAKRLNELNNNNINKMRLIEINKYYEEKYNDHAGFIKYLILFIIILLINYILHRRLLISDGIYNILLFIIILIGFIVLGKYYYKMMFRSNMEYQEYIFPYAGMVGSTSTDTNSSDPWENPTQTCSNNV
jgi:hypothetical protein